MYKIGDKVTTVCMIGETVWEVVGVHDDLYWCHYLSGIGPIDDGYETFTTNVLRQYNGGNDA